MWINVKKLLWLFQSKLQISSVTIAAGWANWRRGTITSSRKFPLTWTHIFFFPITWPSLFLHFKVSVHICCSYVTIRGSEWWSKMEKSFSQKETRFGFAFQLVLFPHAVLPPIIQIPVLFLQYTSRKMTRWHILRGSSTKQGAVQTNPPWSAVVICEKS